VLVCLFVFIKSISAYFGTDSTSLMSWCMTAAGINTPSPSAVLLLVDGGDKKT
jgi:hypothetical protein